jgi:hypothetical protein
MGVALPDPNGLQLVEHRLTVIAGTGVAPEISGIEALRVSGLRAEFSGFVRIVRKAVASRNRSWRG